MLERRKRSICPKCDNKMEYHNQECTASNGRTTPAPHYFCASCDVEALPNGKWRRGSPNPYSKNFMNEKEWKEHVKALTEWHEPEEK